MNTDAELLRLAARVAGITMENSQDDQLDFFNWNPLTDDGDALRLAVGLRIAVSQFGSECAAQRAGWPIFTEEFKGDNCRATRRVIVRAAAGMAPVTNNSDKAHCPQCGICHTHDESCEEAKHRINSIGTRP